MVHQPCQYFILKSLGDLCEVFIAQITQVKETHSFSHLLIGSILALSGIISVVSIYSFPSLFNSCFQRLITHFSFLFFISMLLLFWIAFHVLSQLLLYLIRNCTFFHLFVLFYFQYLLRILADFQHLFRLHITEYVQMFQRHIQNTLYICIYKIKFTVARILRSLLILYIYSLMLLLLSKFVYFFFI